MKKVILGIAFMVIGVVTYAQFTMSGEVRPRAEYRHGFKKLADSAMKAGFFIDQRTRLNLNYKNENFKTGIVVQDIRTWGSQSQLNSTDGLLSIHQAWGELVFNPKLSLKAGRQEIIYDDHRIFGSVGWAQQARSHDAAILKVKDTASKFRLDIGLAFNQDSPKLNTTVYTVPKSYKTFQYVWLNKKAGAASISFLLLNNGLQYSETDTAGVTTYSTKFSQTVGPRIVYKKGKLNLATAFYFQAGKDGGDNDLSAYDFMLDVSYKLADNFTAGVGYELLSGTSEADSANTKNNSFSPFYGTNHKFNGFMDYFYVGNHGSNVGLQDIFVKLIYEKNKAMIRGDVHIFSAAADVVHKTDRTTMSAGLGTEIDLTFKYNIAKGTGLAIGYSHLLGTDTMTQLRMNNGMPMGGDLNETNNWAYLMLTIKPTFITGK